MELPTYNGTCHPDKYIKRMRAYCKINQITNENEILELCILMLDSIITIPNEINSLDELTTSLKSHSTFNIFKNTCKAKLKFLKYVSEKEGGNTATFLANFRSLCDDAEIDDVEEITNYLLNTLSSDKFLKVEFKRKLNGINSVDEILEIFSDIVIDELNVIRYGSLVAFKHVATGKYLSSCNKNYSTGSGFQIVFAKNNLSPNSVWVISKNDQLPNEPFDKPLSYGNPFYLIHKVSGNKLDMDKRYKSPTTKHAEVCTAPTVSQPQRLRLIATNPVNNDNNNNNNCILSKEIINIQNLETKLILRSHDFTFTLADKNYQEVVGHDKRMGGNDKWCIELLDDNSFLELKRLVHRMVSNIDAPNL
ncbi:unnamed protein product [Rhizophagus irregularis]|nr:unnamed protein product [Rhizophagus irregularis]